MLRTLLGLVVILLISPSWAEEMTPATQEAIRKTQELLRSSALRKEALKSAPAQAADKKVGEVARTKEDSDAIYALAAEIFGDLMEKSGGDPEKVMQILEAGKNDPEGFAKQWSPKQLEELRKIAEKIQSSTPIN